MDVNRPSALDTLPNESRRSSELDRKSLGQPEDSHDVESIAPHPMPEDVPVGHAVTRMDNIFKVFGKRGKGIWGIWISIGLISYACKPFASFIQPSLVELSDNADGLAGVLVYNFLAFATSYFGQHAVLGTINVAVYVVGGVGSCLILSWLSTWY
jgi:hypothetical protein